MKYIHQLYEAVKFAVDTHATVSDGYGKDGKIAYFYHVISVARKVAQAGGSIDMQIASVLHDVVEDTVTTLAEVEVSFGSRVAELVALMTKMPGEPLDPYIEALVQDQEAAGIKAADIADNLTREDELKDGIDNHIRRLKKYERGLMLLHSGLMTYEELESLSGGRRSALRGRLHTLFPILDDIDKQAEIDDEV